MSITHSVFHMTLTDTINYHNLAFIAVQRYT